MKTIATILTILLASFFVHAQDTPWKKEQIMPTKILADKLKNNNKDLPLILNVGPMENITTAKSTGNTDSPEGIKKLKETVAALDKKTEIVIYCGCCSYNNCQNIRPAFITLQAEGFKNIKILDIPEGFRENWVAHGYPTE